VGTFTVKAIREPTKAITTVNGIRLDLENPLGGDHVAAFHVDAI
jgi:hypothetical protein